MSPEQQGKRPRHIAAEIIQLPTLEARREALSRVQPEWQDLVRAHLVIAWNHPARNP